MDYNFIVCFVVGKQTQVPNDLQKKKYVYNILYITGKDFSHLAYLRIFCTNVHK